MVKFFTYLFIFSLLAWAAILAGGALVIEIIP